MPKNKIRLVASYCDKAKSGTNTDREGFRAMVAAAMQHKFDCVVVYDITRGSRDVADWFMFRKQMSLLGIQVVSATQHLGDITDPSDFLTELISVGLGEHQVLDTRKIHCRDNRAAKISLFASPLLAMTSRMVNT
ncbi:MAG: recombinase family protein [Anaeromassilibacillus sp.]